MMFLKVILFVFPFVLHKTSATPITYQCDPSARCGCSSQPAVISKIIGGEAAMNQSWGWAVILWLNNSYLCGGSIISESWILTAAHCTIEMEPQQIIVIAGTNRLNGVQQVRYGIQVINHPNYDGVNIVHDIALIQVHRPFNMSDRNVAKVCLPEPTTMDYPPINSSLVVVGWGRTSSNGPVANNLQQVTLQRVALSDRRCRPIINDPYGQICAADWNGTKDSCNGDSGGPLMLFSANRQWITTGIVSFGYGCALPRYAGVYTRVSYYLDWIRSMNVSGFETDSDVVTIPTTTSEISTTSNTIRLSTGRSSAFSIKLSLAIIVTILVKQLDNLFE